jgi:hypothetical protein
MYFEEHLQSLMFVATRFQKHRICGLMPELLFFIYFCASRLESHKSSGLMPRFVKKKFCFVFKIRKTQELWFDATVCIYYYLLLCFWF